MREPSQLNSVMVGRVYRVWHVSHLLGGPGTPPLCSAVNNRLHMDRTTRIGIFSMVGRKLSHFGYRHEYRRGLYSLRQWLVLKNDGVALKLARSS